MHFFKVLLVLSYSLVIAAAANTPRIINGTPATFNNTGHQVSIRLKENEIIFGTGHICGGSLIGSSVVLSAAHCFYNDLKREFHSGELYFVVLGTLDRFEMNENTLSFDIKAIVYGDFDRPTYHNDIAIVFIDGKVPASNPITRIIPINREVIPAGQMCQVTGWGKTETGLLSVDLMTVDVPIIDNKTCSKNYGETTIKTGMICAGYMDGHKDSSNGDSGGPLVSKGKLVGIVSFGNASSFIGYPGVYTDVRHYADWIDETIKKNSAGLKSSSLLAVLIGLMIIF